MITIDQKKLSELEAFKHRVAVISKKYAKKHNLCSVVDDALREIGVDPGLATPQKQHIQATAVVAFNTWIDPVDFAGLDEEGQLNKLTELVKSGAIKPAYDKNTIEVTEAEDALETSSDVALPDGLKFANVAPGGRVKHIVADDVQSAEYTLSICDIYVVVDDEIPATSTGVCKKCERKLVNYL